MGLHAVDLNGFDKIPNVLQLNRNKKASFLLSVSIQKLSNFRVFWCWLVGLFCLFYTSSLPCANWTKQLAWLGMTGMKFEIIFHQY